MATALAMVAAACGGGESTTTTAAPATTTTTAAGETTTTSGSEEPPSGGLTTLQVVMSEEATDLIPFTVGQQGKNQVFQAMLMPLLEMTADNEISSRILDEWGASEDARTVTLRLKSDIEWSDGTPMTTADILRTLTIYLDNNFSSQAGRYGGVLGQAAFVEGTTEDIEGLRVIDDLTIEIELANPDAAWLPNLASGATNLPILPAHILGDVPNAEMADHEYFRTFPVTSGPYNFVQFVEGQFAEFVRNDNYSLGTPGFERVFFRIVATDVQSAQLETGEVQFIFAIDPADADRIGNIPGVTVGSKTGIAPELWSIMHDDGSLDVRVRQAMLFAIDREAICQQAMQGYCSTPVTNIRQLAPAWAIPTDGLIEYTYNPDRARELLAEAEDDGAWDPDTELVFYHRPGRGYTDTAITIAQAQMAEVGINWTVINTDTGGLIDAIREQPIGTLQGFWVSGANFTVDPSATQVYYSCDTARTGANLISYCRPELDELWKAGRLTTVQDERQEIYHDAYRFMNADPARIYLYVVDNIVAYDERLKGVKPHGGVGFPYWNIGEWYWEE
jgi:peptide/nickel transport system substrate-binding protein